MSVTKASAVIPTRGRVPELRVLLDSLCSQTIPLEIIVMDDGGSDATKHLIETQFPQVIYRRIGDGRGPAFQRNRGIELASNNIVFPLDDDTALPSPYTIEQTLAEFDDSRVAAVGIPHVNVCQDSIVRQKAPADIGIYLIHAFVGAAHAVRRDVFLAVGGYREHFFYMVEESDLCIRLLQAGFITIAGRADVIHHFESSNRMKTRAEFCGRRNDILFVWHNVPTMFAPQHLLGTTLNGVRSAVVAKSMFMVRGTVAGYVDSARLWTERAPVSVQVYRLHRKLKKHGPRLLSEVEHLLPPIVVDWGSELDPVASV